MKYGRWIAGIGISLGVVSLAPAQSFISGQVRGALEQVLVLIQTQNGESWQVVRADADGRYRYAVEPGVYWVEALSGSSSPSFAATASMNPDAVLVKVGNDDVLDVDFTLESTWITGRVVDEMGVPIAGASVTVSPEERYKEDYEREDVKTGEDGRFAVQLETGRRVGIRVAAQAGAKDGERQVTVPPDREVEIQVRNPPCSLGAHVIVGFTKDVSMGAAVKLFGEYAGELGEVTLSTTEMLYPDYQMLAGFLPGVFCDYRTHPLEAENPTLVQYVARDLALEHEQFEPKSEPASDWHTRKIDAPAVWAWGNTGRGVRVCVIDSGVHRHPALESRVVRGRSFGFQSSTSPHEDTTGHGTAMAGLIAAKRDYPVGERRLSLGVAPSATIVPLKVSLEFSALFAALMAAIDEKCKVVNFSMVVRETDFAKQRPELLGQAKAILDALAEKKIVVVTSAGNDNSAARTWPCLSGQVICVGGSDQMDVRWIKSDKVGSNYGSTDEATGRNNHWVHAAAPAGENVFMLVQPDRVGFSSGTSAAAAIVSGAAALIVGKYLDLNISPEQVKDRLQRSGVLVKSKPVGRYQPYIGKRINVNEAVFR